MMTTVIHKENWKEFFDQLSREKLDWETTIQVLSEETGAQFLSSGLPFAGLTYDEKDDESKIEVIVGSDTEHHQTHNIFNPKFAAYESVEEKNEFTLDIENSDGTKTLIKFTEPLPAVVNRSDTEAVSMVSQT